MGRLGLIRHNAVRGEAGPPASESTLVSRLPLSEGEIEPATGQSHSMLSLESAGPGGRKKKYFNAHSQQPPEARRPEARRDGRRPEPGSESESP
jgi:hypothetical protein